MFRESKKGTAATSSALDEDMQLCFRIVYNSSVHLHTQMKVVQVDKCAIGQKSRAGHFRYFFIFSLIKNDFFALFIK